VPIFLHTDRAAAERSLPLYNGLLLLVSELFYGSGHCFVSLWGQEDSGRNLWKQGDGIGGDFLGRQKGVKLLFSESRSTAANYVLRPDKKQQAP
jgi:hypothetical protein